MISKAWLVAGGAVALGLLGVAALVVARQQPVEHSRPVPDRSVPAGGVTTPPRDLATRLRRADVANGSRVFAVCAACHSVGRFGPDVDGPNLYGVVGSAVAGRRPRYGYTAALRHIGGRWSFERLDAWLTDPQAFVPKTSMGFEGLSDPQERADVIAFLNQQGSNLPIP